MLTGRQRIADSRGTHGEAGTAAIMVAMLMTVFCVVAALVLDIGLARVDKQVNKAAGDVAAAAGIRGVAGTDGRPKPFRGVCDALRYLRANRPGIAADLDLTGTWRRGDGTLVGVGNPCSNPTYRTLTCTPNAPDTWAWYSATADGGDITVDIKSGYQVSDPLFASDEAMVGGDAGSSAQGGCDQLAVIITERERPGFGAVVRTSDLVTRVRSVARITPGTRGDAAPALILLERSDCGAVQIEGSNATVRVQGNGPRPGMIHADSLGTGPSCISQKIIDGNFSAPARIWAEDAESGSPLEPGVIGVVALSGAAGANPANASDSWPSQVYAEGQTGSVPAGGPTGRPLVGRAPVDRRYQQAVENSIGVATSQWNLSASTAGDATNNYAVIGCSTTSSTAMKVFVDCPGGVAYSGTVSFSNAETVVFNGPVQVTGGGRLQMPRASTVYIKGSLSQPGLLAEGTLNVNDRGTACPSQSPYGSRLVIGSGSFQARGGASVLLCQTTVIMADGFGGLDCPVGGRADDVPIDNACRGRVTTAGSASVVWSAPNAVGPEPNATHWANLEDLALWTETSGNDLLGTRNHLEGSGTLGLAGVFFLPNANPFRVAGGGAQSMANAQFVARKLRVAGNASLLMRPNPHDVVTIPYSGDTMLVR